MPFTPVKLHPGPTVLAAAGKLAGFSDTSYYPAVTDACGKRWLKPSGLQIMLAIVGGESSGHAWAYRDDGDGSTDFGLCQINNHSTSVKHAAWLNQAPQSPGVTGSLNWANYADNLVMAYQMHADANYGWGPWHAYSGGGYLAERYKGHSWMDWAQHGIDTMNAQLKAGKPLLTIASIDLDTLVYWSD